MTTLPIHITAQGRAALVNATHTGTAPVTIASIGVTETWFDPSTDPLALPGQIKALSTIAGTVVAADVIHVTLRDDSADAYDLRGFGLYLDDGTLFAVHAQPDVILAKTASSMLLLSADIQLADIDAASITFGDASFANPPASETISGVLRLATDAQAIAGTDRTRAVPPGALKAALDARLGPAAPSSFIKGLLSLATAAALRAALSIKSAALKDEGAGNGLDADTVDGKHASEFAAAAHKHGWTDITGTPTAFPPAAHTHGWTDITGTPTAFPPAAHTHAAADIISGTLNADRIPTLAISKVAGLQGALDGKVARQGDTMTGPLRFELADDEWSLAIQSAGTVLGGIWRGADRIGLVNSTDGWKGLWVNRDGSISADGPINVRQHSYALNNGLIYNIAGSDHLGFRVGTGSSGFAYFRMQNDGYFVLPNGGVSAAERVSAREFASNGYNAGPKYFVGDDVALHDVDLANTLGVRGIQSSARGFILFGTAPGRVGWDGTAHIVETALRVSGDVTANGFSVASSRALKRDIRPLRVDADIVDRFQPVVFRYRAAPDRDVAGLIREDVAEIFPLACTGDGIDYGQLVPLLIATIQHDRAQLRDLIARVEALEHRSEE